MCQMCTSMSLSKSYHLNKRHAAVYVISLVDWISDTHPQGYTDLQSLVKCLDHRFCDKSQDAVMQDCVRLRNALKCIEMHLRDYHYSHVENADANSRSKTVCYLQTTSCSYIYSSRRKSSKRTLREELEEGTRMFFTKHLFAMGDRATELQTVIPCSRGHLEPKCSAPTPE